MLILMLQQQQHHQTYSDILCLMRHAVLQILGVNSSPYFCVKVWVSISNLVLLFDRVAFRPTDQEEEEEGPITATIVVDVVVIVVAVA